MRMRFGLEDDSEHTLEEVGRVRRHPRAHSRDRSQGSAEQLKSLDGASQIELGFPQSIYEREMVRAIRYGGMWDRLLL